MWNINAPQGSIPCAIFTKFAEFVPAQACPYLVYSEADFEVFRPAGATRCTDGVKFGTEEGTEVPNVTPSSVQRQGCRTPKIEIFTQI